MKTEINYKEKCKQITAFEDELLYYTEKNKLLTKPFN